MTDSTLYALVLAAGASSRFGSTKQVARLDGQPLVARATRNAEAVCDANVVLVTGNDWRAVTAAAAPMAGYFVVNPRFQEGLSTSIGCGVRALPDDADGVLIVLADQPLVTAAYLQRLADAWQRHTGSIVASAWQDVSGPPVIFPRDAFRDLQSLSGDAGARKVIESGRHPVECIDFADGAVDVDRPEDLEKLDEADR
jgi:molybdenum cofactor cytidylyltransferase